MQSFHIDDIITILILVVVAVIIPGTLTIWNIYNCVSKKPKHEKLISTLTVFVGGILYLMLHALDLEEAGDWKEAIYPNQYHYSLSPRYWAVALIVIVGFIGYFVLLYESAEKLPPLIAVLSICMLILMNVFQLVYAVQLSKNVDRIDCLLYVYHANILILSARIIQKHMVEEVEILKNRISEGNGRKGINAFVNKIDSISKYSICIFIALFFVIAIIEIIFVLMGQGIDAPIKIFTDTADWTFSKQIPPPPLEYKGHYLCTVAAGGHRKIVKPIRLGTRRNATIVVNRQLCVANAFEEMLQERVPGLHRRVRLFYDSYGYPVSKVITTPLRADLIYLMMKPMEWIFLIALYMVDSRPEQRIARQYSYKCNQHDY